MVIGDLKFLKVLNIIKELNGFSEDLDIEPYEGSIIEDLVIGYSIESKISLIEEVIEILELSKS